MIIINKIGQKTGSTYSYGTRDLCRLATERISRPSVQEPAAEIQSSWTGGGRHTNIHLPVSRVDWAPDGWTDKRQTIEKKNSFSSSPSLNGRNERSSAERDNAAGVNLSISTVNSANPNPVRCQIVFYDRDSAAYERSGGGASALQKDMFTKVKPSHTHFVD